MRPSEYKSSYACTESNQIQNHIQPMLMENLYSGGVMNKKNNNNCVWENWECITTRVWFGRIREEKLGVLVYTTIRWKDDCHIESKSI